jgi:nitrile hydratase accessory protein
VSAKTLKRLVAGAGLDAERVFSAPWEARAFAIAVGLCEAGHFTWDEFRAHLIAEVAKADRVRERDGTSARGEYYEHFLRALEAILIQKGIARAPDVARRIREMESGG